MRPSLVVIGIVSSSIACFACIHTDWARPTQDSQPNTLSVSEGNFFASYEGEGGDGGAEAGTNASRADASSRTDCVVTVNVDASSCATCGEIVLSRDGVDIVRLQSASIPAVHHVAADQAWSKTAWADRDAGDESLTTSTFPIVDRKHGAKLAARAAAARCFVSLSTADVTTCSGKVSVSCAR